MWSQLADSKREGYTESGCSLGYEGDTSGRKWLGHGQTVSQQGRLTYKRERKGPGQNAGKGQLTRGAQPVTGAALAMAEGTFGVEPAGGAEKATAADPKTLELGAYHARMTRQGTGTKSSRIVRPGMELTCPRRT